MDFASSSSWRRPTHTPRPPPRNHRRHRSIPTRTAACASTRPRRKPSRISRTCSNGTETANTRARSSRRKTGERVRRRSTVRVIFSFLSIFVSSRGRNSSRNDALESCANLRVVGRRRRRRRLEDGLAFVVVRAFGSKNALPFFPVVVSRRRRLLGTMVVTWDLESSRIVPLRNASRERESEISARVVGTRKGGAAAKRQRTESQRATMTLRSKEGAFFFVLDQVFYGWLRSKTKNVFSVLVWSFFLSFSLSFFLSFFPLY